jgi:hypothetical protein
MDGWLDGWWETRWGGGIRMCECRGGDADCDGCLRMGWDGIGWDGMAWHGMEWDWKYDDGLLVAIHCRIPI